MLLVGGALAVLGFLRVRRIRGPRETIASVKETRTALTTGRDKPSVGAVGELSAGNEKPEPADPSGW